MSFSAVLTMVRSRDGFSSCKTKDFFFFFKISITDQTIRSIMPIHVYSKIYYSIVKAKDDTCKRATNDETKPLMPEQGLSSNCCVFKLYSQLEWAIITQYIQRDKEKISDLSRWQSMLSSWVRQSRRGSTTGTFHLASTYCKSAGKE